MRTRIVSLGSVRRHYLVLCWMLPPEGEAANSNLDRHFREYGEKGSRDLARQERLSTLRSRKRFPTDDHQNPGRSRKRQKTLATTSASQNHTYPSHQVVEDLLLDVDVRSVDLNPI
jgi:hypothetical protein